MNTILITGCSSGFGLETARLFLDRGWRVVATMRTPRAALLPKSDRLTVLPLDVTDAGSIARTVAEAGPLDVLVNNAGVGLLNALEGLSMESAREVFETNTGGCDVLHDEGVLYADRLEAASVGVIRRNFPGMIHGFIEMAGVLSATGLALDTIAFTLREYLQM